MGTFLAPFPSPRPVFATAADDTEFSSTASADDGFSSIHAADEFSILALLLAMHDDVGAGPFAADAATLPAFFVHEQDQPAGAAMMPLQPVSVDPPCASLLTPGREHGCPAAGDGAKDGTSRPAKRRRRRRLQTTSSPSESARGESSGQAQALAATRASRRVWVRERSTEWWDRLNGSSSQDDEFRRAFRMSRATFGALCDALGSAVAKEDTPLRAAIPVRQRVAVCLWRLATGEPLREVSRRFGLGISTCHNIVLQVCHALATVLMPGAIYWPDAPAAAPDVAARFEAASGIPGVVGAVYTTHVPIVAPKADVGAYYDRCLTERNQKASYSVAVQAVADADGAFTDVCIGHPGSLSDAAVLGRSALYASRGEAGLLQGQQQWLVGGASYPLTDWMLVPYAHRNLTWAQHKFNERVAAARGAARGAVRRLKARWRCLQRRTEVKMQDLPSMIAACCVLHNVCERAGDGLDPYLMEYELDDGDDVVAHDAAPSAAAAQARDRIAHDLLHGSHANDRAFQWPQ